MTEKKITIRPETKDDYRAVENLTREAFWNVYRPGCMEHYVLHCYRDDPAFVPELDLVMELDGRLMGQAIYVRSEIDCDDGRTPRFRTWKRCPGGADTPTAPTPQSRAVPFSPPWPTAHWMSPVWSPIES